MSADAKFGVQIEPVGAFFYVGQSHAGAKAELARERPGRGPAFLHGEIDVFDAGTAIHGVNRDAIGLDDRTQLAANGVDDDVGLGLVRDNGGAAAGFFSAGGGGDMASCSTEILNFPIACVPSAYC